MTIKARHIGDGVYVSFDGYGIDLAVNDHMNRVAYLEPSVMEHLIKYWSEIKKAKAEE